MKFNKLENNFILKTDNMLINKYNINEIFDDCVKCI